MSKVKYEDRFAQIRQIANSKRAVCYWRNNLSLNDFIKDGSWYVFEDTGSYNGLNVWMRITVKRDSIKRLFQRKHKGVIEFWGDSGHMGIMVRMRTRKFPKIHKGSEGWLTYEFSMDGTADGLVYIGKKTVAKHTEKSGLRKHQKINKNTEELFDERIYQKEAC